MLEEWKFDWKKLDEAECKVRLKARRLDLAGLQQPIKGAGLPVIVLIEGWGASGKGSMIRSLIRELDPRGFLVRSVTMPTQEERRWPFLKRHFEAIPEQGKTFYLLDLRVDGRDGAGAAAGRPVRRGVPAAAGECEPL